MNCYSDKSGKISDNISMTVSTSAGVLNLLKLKRSGSDLFGSNTLVVHDHTGAGVPAQNGVIVFSRPHFFGAVVRLHGVAQLLVDHAS